MEGGGVLIILSFLTATADAKSTPSLSVILSPASDLSDRLAADENFKAYSISTYQFIAKVRETKSGKMLIKYLNQTSTFEEKESLALTLGYDSEKSLKSFLITTLQQKVTLDQKFPELQDFAKNQSDIRLARSKAIGSLTKPLLTAEDCWDMFFALSTIWLNLCLLEPDWQACWIWASAQISTTTISCLLIAD